MAPHTNAVAHDLPADLTTGLVDWAVRCVRGPVREDNQDVARIERRPDLGLAALVVADGMGGHAQGRVAAEIMGKHGGKVLEAGADRRNWPRVFAATVRAAHLEIREQVEIHGSMGTTVALAVIDLGEPRRLHWMHVGDSRIYLRRGGMLLRLTQDHSKVWKMVAAGLLAEDEALGHPDANILSRAVGQEIEPEVDVGQSVVLEAGDWILASSDGLHGVLSDGEILGVLKETASADEAVRRLVTKALQERGQDNISVACVRLVRTQAGLSTTRPEAQPSAEQERAA